MPGKTTSSALKDPSLLASSAFINGSWVKADDGKTFAVTNPATDEVLVEVADVSRQQVKEAINAAKAAQSAWAARTAYERQALLVKLLDEMRKNLDDLALILTLENGKPLAEAKGEIGYGAGFVDWFAAEAVRTYGHNVPSAIPGTRNNVIRQPIGVCGLITPWNFPNAMITRKMAPALAAGCTVVIKAPAETPLSALAMCVLCQRAGIPAGVVNCVTVSKGEREAACGLELCENPLVSKISFTGSTPVGRLLMRQSSTALHKLSMELGGNAPFIVFADADLDVAVSSLIASKFRASGQTCVCANRIYVHADIYDAFSKRLSAKVEQLVVGDPLEASTQLGPLINQAAVDKVKRHIDDAVAKGAKVLTGGAAQAQSSEKKGSFFPPTILTNVPQGAAVESEETFGPLVPLFTFKEENAVLGEANRSEFGLAGYIFTSDINRLHRVSEKLQVGMVAVNTGVVSQPCIPFGGVKSSGFGREGGRSGMDEYMTEKLVTIGNLN